MGRRKKHPLARMSVNARSGQDGRRTTTTAPTTMLRDQTGSSGRWLTSPRRKSSPHNGDSPIKLQRPRLHSTCCQIERKSQDQQCGGVTISRLFDRCPQPKSLVANSKAEIVGACYSILYVVSGHSPRRPSRKSTLLSVS